MDTFWNRGRSTRRKGIREQKEINDRLIKDEITRDIRTLFGKEDYYKPKKKKFSIIIIILNMKEMVMEIETYHSTNILTKLNLTWGV